jgi:hypothetical protein
MNREPPIPIAEAEVAAYAGDPMDCDSFPVVWPRALA